MDKSRTPHGVRGLKSKAGPPLQRRPGRTPHGVRGLKFAPHLGRVGHGLPQSHPSRGAWIEIRLSDVFFWLKSRRTPHGVRGLKSQIEKLRNNIIESHPSRGAWIEMLWKWSAEVSVRSHPSRGAWIEMVRYWPSVDLHMRVAPLTGCVD